MVVQLRTVQNQNLIILAVCVPTLGPVSDPWTWGLVWRNVMGVCQDVGHPGYNNNFLINLRHEYAVTFGDLDVLEIGKQKKAWKVLRMTPKQPKHACAACTVSCLF